MPDLASTAQTIADTVLGDGAAGLGSAEVAAGLRQALEVGTERVVTRLGQEDGFNASPRFHIPLPDPLADAQSALRMVGLSALADDLELRLNRAAEQATPLAKDLFWAAIGRLTFDDVMAIYQGPEDAATRYLEDQTRTPLARAMEPLVEDALADAGALRLYDQLLGRARDLPLVPDLEADLTVHVLDRAMYALFTRLAVEEAAIRQDPAKRTTELLRRVFGAKA